MEIVGLSVVGTSPILVSSTEGPIVALLGLGSLVTGISPEGLLVGAAVGKLVGAFDGISVGTAVGFFVGAFDGKLVGSFVGFLVGAGVGS